MSLHRRGNVQNKNSARQWIILAVVCFLLCVLFIGGISYARYVESRSGRLEMNVAQWKMKVNGILLADTAAASKITVEFVPVESGVAVPSEKIKPGQSGYFDIEIDPNGTETSFTYRIKADIAKSYLPNGMSIDGYSVSGDAPVEFDVGAERAVEGTMALPEAGIFSTDDKVTIRFFWTWADVEFDEYAEYDIVVTAVVVQYCGEQTSGVSSEGGETL